MFTRLLKKRDTTSQGYFEEKYRNNPDPWNFTASEYEQTRYSSIVSALNHRRYRRAFEPGCSIGILTRRLAEICDLVEATDISPTAVEEARKLCKDLPSVNVVCGEFSTALPPGSFDLIVFSEIGYYFQEQQLRDLGEKLVGQLEKGGTLLASHWLGSSKDHILNGNRVHRILDKLPGLKHAHSELHPDFRIDLWERI